MADWLNKVLREQLERMPFLKKLPAWAWWLILLGIMSAGAMLTSTNGNNPSDPALASPLESAGLAVSVLMKLILVIALIYASLYLLRRWKGAFPGASARQMSVVETLRLSQRQSLHLVQVGDRVVLIGATDENLSLLTEVDSASQPKGDSSRSILQKDALEPAMAIDFQSLLVERSAHPEL